MKKKFVLVLIVLIVGCLVIALLYFFSGNQETILTQNKLVNAPKEFILDREFISKPDTEITAEIKSPFDIQGKNKIYFEGIDKLEPFLNKDQIEDLENKVQSYVHSYISNDILECNIKSESIKQLDNKITFELTMKDVKRFEVLVTKDNKDNKVVDITMQNYL